MDWTRVGANFVMAFATAFLAVNWIGGTDSLFVALFNAIFVGLIAASKEILADSPKKKHQQISKVLASGLVA